MACLKLQQFAIKWDKKYLVISDIWQRNWSWIIPFFAFPAEIRKVIYTTNTIEFVNRHIRKIIKNKGVIPDDKSIQKIIFLSLQNAAKKWTMPIKDRSLALNQFEILCGDFKYDLLEKNIQLTQTKRFTLMIWNSETLSNALGVAIPYSIICNEVQFNSKDVIKGDLFIALQGNSNGHDYVQDAINKGANAVIVSKQVDIPDKNKIIIVDNCCKALQKMAEYKRNYSKAKFIAIAGSVGKTSTKEALKAILSKSSNVFASRGNFNNKLGMLINLASMPDDIVFNF